MLAFQGSRWIPVGRDFVPCTSIFSLSEQRNDKGLDQQLDMFHNLSLHGELLDTKHLPLKSGCGTALRC